MSSIEEVKEVQLFRVAVQSHFEKIAKSVSEERVLELFKGGGVSKSQSKKLYKVFQSVVVEGLNEQVNEMIVEEKLPQKFKDKTELLEVQRKFEGSAAWRPTGEPSEDLRSHDMGALQHLKSALQNYLSERKTRVDVLSESVRSARKSATEAHSTIQRLTRRNAEEDALLDEAYKAYLKTLNTLALSAKESRRNLGPF